MEVSARYPYAAVADVCKPRATAIPDVNLSVLSSRSGPLTPNAREQNQKSVDDLALIDHPQDSDQEAGNPHKVHSDKADTPTSDLVGKDDDRQDRSKGDTVVDDHDHERVVNASGFVKYRSIGEEQTEP